MLSNATGNNYGSFYTNAALLANDVSKLANSAKTEGKQSNIKKLSSSTRKELLQIITLLNSPEQSQIANRDLNKSSLVDKKMETLEKLKEKIDKELASEPKTRHFATSFFKGARNIFGRVSSQDLQNALNAYEENAKAAQTHPDVTNHTAVANNETLIEDTKKAIKLKKQQLDNLKESFTSKSPSLALGVKLAWDGEPEIIKLQQEIKVLESDLESFKSTQKKIQSSQNSTNTPPSVEQSIEAVSKQMTDTLASLKSVQQDIQLFSTLNSQKVSYLNLDDSSLKTKAENDAEKQRLDAMPPKERAEAEKLIQKNLESKLETLKGRNLNTEESNLRGILKVQQQTMTRLTMANARKAP